MTSFYEQYETDKNLESGDGVVLDYGKAGSIIIHRAGGNNRKFLTVTQATLAPYRRQIQAGTLDEGTDAKLMAEIYATSVIVGWKGVKGRDGKTLPFTKANVIKLLLDLPELFADIKEQAANVANFRKAQIEEEAKN